MNITQDQLRYSKPENLEKNFLWKDDVLYILLKNDEYVRMKNPYLTGLEYGFDTEFTEDIVMVGNTKKWRES